MRKVSRYNRRPFIAGVNCHLSVLHSPCRQQREVERVLGGTSWSAEGATFEPERSGARGGRSDQAASPDRGRAVALVSARRLGYGGNVVADCCRHSNLQRARERPAPPPPSAGGDRLPRRRG